MCLKLRWPRTPRRWSMFCGKQWYFRVVIIENRIAVRFFARKFPWGLNMKFRFFTKLNYSIKQSCLVISVACVWESCCCQSRLYLDFFSMGEESGRLEFCKVHPGMQGFPKQWLPSLLLLSLQHLLHFFTIYSSYNCISIELWWIDSLSELSTWFILVIVLQLPDINKDHPSTTLFLAARA